MAFRYCIRFGGAGGQGLIQAGRIIAEAAAIYDNKNAAESCSYGPEARGSASRAEIIISDEIIDYPRTDSVDFLLALTQQAYDKYIRDLLPDGIAVIDSRIELSDQTRPNKIYSVPLIEIAETKCGKSSMVDIVALGFFAGVNKIINRDSIRKAILARIPRNSEEIFLAAYEAGLEASNTALEKK